ncbi:hypothetical protein FDP41_002014 [Naegleria fowleri]|uniref:Uncharacterized protein n=1 Tax=Naegleria fowleri TaxID=5763 RepID=A0A6A5BXA4_NAEFO|nr:uncharacterized protein FDP41_002014 [Naegleria fowleri]KAF0978944.1 hypothetical protein FDP41_002014 [Naegleria fowleri]CAG4711423.1 unnamed protein product [Naegleria fowleri]
MQQHFRLNVRVIADGFSLSVPSPSSSNNTDLNSSLGISLLEKVNPFYRRLLFDNSNNNHRPSSTIQLSNPRNFRCIVPEQSSLNDVKQTICKQYQMIFYERSDESTSFEDTTFFTVSRIYNERGIEMGLWNSHLKCSDIFNDEQLIYVKLDSMRRNGLKLKDQYTEVTLWSSPNLEKENSFNSVNESEKITSPSKIDYETPKKRKTVESTPNSKKQKLTNPISAYSKKPATSLVSSKLETSQLSSDNDHDSVASNSEDESDIISPEVTPKRKITSTSLKKTATSAPTANTTKREEKVVKTEAVKTRSKIRQEEQKKQDKKQTESIYISDASEESDETEEEVEEEQEQEPSDNQEEEENEKQEEKIEKEDESEVEEKEENEDMTPEQYAKYYANLKPWLKANMVNGKFKDDEQYQKFRESFKLLSSKHQAEILEYIKDLKRI